MGNVHGLSTGWAKNVIPLVQCNVMYERYHFFGPPCMARWKAHGRLPINANWIFFAKSYGWGAMSKYWSKLCCLKGGWVIWAQISGRRGSSTNEFWRQKTKSPGLSRGVVCVILRLAVLIQYRRVTDTQTDT